MKNHLVLIIIASGLAFSVVIIRHAAQAQNMNAQPADQMGGMMSGTGGANRDNQTNSPAFVTEIPPGYRDWRLVSVAHEAGKLNDIRAILGNDTAITAYREGTLPFPDGTIIARLAWAYVPSEENNRIFGRAQSYVPGAAPDWYLQFMVKDTKKYAATGGWGFAQFDPNGKPAAAAMMTSCFPCHQNVKARDFVFTRYAP